MVSPLNLMAKNSGQLAHILIGEGRDFLDVMRNFISMELYLRGFTPHLYVHLYRVHLKDIHLFKSIFMMFSQPSDAIIMWWW